MNRIQALFKKKKESVLNIYFTAGHPRLDSLLEIVPALYEAGVDLVEIGMPYSDPLADGETIQASSKIALKNGMHLSLLFEQITQLRETCDIPLILMGYYNQLIQYGIEKFFMDASAAGVDGLIIPDLPLDEYASQLKNQFEKYNLGISFLVTPKTSDARIREAAELSSDFLYIISSSSITGSKSDIEDTQLSYFKRVEELAPDTPRLIGFGIHDKASFDKAAAQANGAIIGSAFIRHLDSIHGLAEASKTFVQNIKGV